MISDEEKQLREDVLDALLHCTRDVDRPFGLANLVWWLRCEKNQSVSIEIADVVQDLVSERYLGWGSSLDPDIGPMAGFPWVHVRARGEKLIAAHRAKRDAEAKAHRAAAWAEEQKKTKGSAA